jgi:DNA-binding NtrC family response regulator
MKLLILEDDPGSQDILLENLQHRGFDVEVCGRLEDAFMALAQRPFDAVLCDIRLPGCSGMEHVERLCREYSECVIVVMTGYPSLETCLDALQLGAYGYLVKPFKVDEVHEMLERGHRERLLRTEVSGLRDRVAHLEQELRRARGAEGDPGGVAESGAPSA